MKANEFYSAASHAERLGQQYAFYVHHRMAAEQTSHLACMARFLKQFEGDTLKYLGIIINEGYYRIREALRK